MRKLTIIHCGKELVLDVSDGKLYDDLLGLIQDEGIRSITVISPGNRMIIPRAVAVNSIITEEISGNKPE